VKLLVSAFNFGLGGAGKMASILDELRDAEVIIYGSELGANLFEDDVALVAEYSYNEASVNQICRRHRIDVALIILDPRIASAATESCPVVYVDSLPFLWTHPSDVPVGVAAYLAQQTPLLPMSCWETLRTIDALQWTEGIVPCERDNEPSTVEPTADVLINLGGLLSVLQTSGDISYPHVVLPPLLEQLAERGFTSAMVTTSPAARNQVERAIGDRTPLDLTVQSLGHRDFGRALRSAQLVATSPGLTTILESGAARVPTVLLPPQNMSQIMNMAFVANLGGGDRCIDWPETVLEPKSVEHLRLKGEEVVVEHIYGAIDRAVAVPELFGELALRFGQALVAKPACPTSRLADLVGTGGAKQVAGVVRELATHY
jgi:hydroxymethylcytosylglucuronate/cytosylglucuronate synthase